MKITSINNVQLEPISNINKINLAPTNSISFKGEVKSESKFLDKMFHKFEASLLKSESKRIEKRAQKELANAQKIQENAKEILAESSEYYQRAMQNRDEIFSMIIFDNNGELDGISRDSLDGIEIKRASADGTYLIREQLSDGKLREVQIPKGGDIIVQITDSKSKKTDMFVYDSQSQELKFCAKNVDLRNGEFRADRKFVFEEDKLLKCDEYCLKFPNNIGHQYFATYTFEDDRLKECDLSTREIETFMSVEDIYYFSENEKLRTYCANSTCSFKTGDSTTGVEIRYNEDGKVKLAIKDSYIDSSDNKNYGKMFEYNNGVLRAVLIDSDILSPFNLVASCGYTFEGDRTYCHLDLKRNSEKEEYSKKITL